jgi:hypothetical protein
VHVIPAEKVIRVYTGADVVTFDPRPTVSKWQFVQACVDAGITEAQLDAAVALLTCPRSNSSGLECSISGRGGPRSADCLILRTSL